MGDEKDNVNLCCVKKMGAWKGNHFLGDWCVVPRLDVAGTICIDGKEIDVTGCGYHDHNNYPLVAPFYNRGANFGKIVAGPINVVWAQVMRNNKNSENIVVINTEDTFESIQSKDIQLSIKDSVTEHGKIVPTHYVLHVEKQDMCINVEIESLNYHYVTIPSVKYWRHHARNTGEIRVGSLLKNVDTISIIDQLSFL
jgi:predicted secreted hydrolase